MTIRYCVLLLFVIATAAAAGKKQKWTEESVLAETRLSRIG